MHKDLPADHFLSVLDHLAAVLADYDLGLAPNLLRPKRLSHAFEREHVVRAVDLARLTIVRP